MTKSTISFTIALVLLATVTFCAGYICRDIKAAKAEMNTCTATHLCPNALNAIKQMKDYQLDVYEDSTIIWDGQRKVAVLPFDSTQALDKQIYFDNQ